MQDQWRRTDLPQQSPEKIQKRVPTKSQPRMVGNSHFNLSSPKDSYMGHISGAIHKRQKRLAHLMANSTFGQPTQFSEPMDQIINNKYQTEFMNVLSAKKDYYANRNSIKK